MYFYPPECCSAHNAESGNSNFAGKPVDIWALGVTAFVLTFRELPFKPENPDSIIELFDLIAQAE